MIDIHNEKQLFANISTILALAINCNYLKASSVRTGESIIPKCLDSTSNPYTSTTNNRRNLGNPRNSPGSDSNTSDRYSDERSCTCRSFQLEIYAMAVTSFLLAISRLIPQNARMLASQSGRIDRQSHSSSRDHHVFRCLLASPPLVCLLRDLTILTDPSDREMVYRYVRQIRTHYHLEHSWTPQSKTLNFKR
jgi:hypothetical protein